MKQSKPLPKNAVVRSPGSPKSLLKRNQLIPQPPCSCEQHKAGTDKGKVS